MRYLERLSAPGRRLTGLESARPELVVEEAVDYSKSEGIERLPKEYRDLIRTRWPTVLGAAAKGEPLFGEDRLVMEAMIRTEGRPSLLIQNGAVDFGQPEAAGWKKLEGYADALSEVIDVVGRIELAGRHIGTGVLIGPDLVLTNRHVAEAIAKAFKKDGKDLWLLKAGGPAIDFNREQGATTKRLFRIMEVVAAGPDPIGRTVDPKRLDAALLRIDLAGDETLTPARLVAPEAVWAEDGGEIVSIGYPGPPAYEPSTIPTEEDRKVMAALQRIFGGAFGVKRFAPGEIMARAGHFQPDGGIKGWVFTHDATTLGGSSGSAVVRCIAGKALVQGLHFGGAWLKHNFAHQTSKLKASILGRPDFTWDL